jgi:hypothetical protein
MVEIVTLRNGKIMEFVPYYFDMVQVVAALGTA